MLYAYEHEKWLLKNMHISFETKVASSNNSMTDWLKSETLQIPHSKFYVRTLMQIELASRLTSELIALLQVPVNWKNSLIWLVAAIK